MTLRSKFIGFIIVIHAVAIGLSFYIFRENKLWFLVSELLILVSIALCWSLFNDLIRPRKLEKAGPAACDRSVLNLKGCAAGTHDPPSDTTSESAIPIGRLSVMQSPPNTMRLVRRPNTKHAVGLELFI